MGWARHKPRRRSGPRSNISSTWRGRSVYSSWPSRTTTRAARRAVRKAR